jgi:hypothetical protein
MYSCRGCPNREWEKNKEDAERQIEICKYCEERRLEGHSCMAGHRSSGGVSISS